MPSPRTVVIAPDGAGPGQTLSFSLAPNVLQYVESVVATIDATGSGDVTPVLTISEQSGVVVADKEQGRVITGGVTGRATWAHRLTDEGGGASSALATEHLIDGTGTTVNAVASTQLPWVKNSGADLLDLTDPFNPLVIAAGTYAFTFVADFVPTPGPFANGVKLGLVVAAAVLGVIPSGVAQSFVWQTAGAVQNELSAAMTDDLPAGTLLQAFAQNSQANAGLCHFGAIVSKLG